MQSNIKLLNKSKICESCFCRGAVGLMEDSTELLHWMICGPELSRCVNEVEANLTCNNDDECEEESEDANRNITIRIKVDKIGLVVKF